MGMSDTQLAAAAKPGPPGRRNEGRRWARVREAVDRTNAIVATAAIVVGWGIGAATIWPFHTSTTPKVFVSISSPATGPVSREIDVRGVARYLRAGERLWVDVLDLSDLRHNPAKEACSVVGSAFRCGQIFIGAPGQHNHKFLLEMWVLGVDQMQPINNYNITAVQRHYPGMTAPPDGTTIATSVEVIRA
jgi:hypothetical protein